MEDIDVQWLWPAWKFGMIMSDQFNTLHDQYNTISTPIQDAQSFHLDVADISDKATTRAEFHLLLAQRKQMRLDELRNCFESVAVELVANPKLMDESRWIHAIQFFRTTSIDSIVAYFATYLAN